MGIQRVDEAGDVLQAVHSTCFFSKYSRVTQIVQSEYQEGDKEDIYRLEVPSAHPIHSYYLSTLAEFHRRLGDFWKASDYLEEALSMKLEAYLDVRFEKTHPEICISLLQCAVAQIDVACSLEDGPRKKNAIAQLVLAFSEDLAPMFCQTFETQNAINLYVQGYFGVAVKLLGGFRGDKQLKQAVNKLTKAPHMYPKDHIWIVNLKAFYE